MKFRILLFVTMLAALIPLASCVTSHDYNLEVSADQFAVSGYVTSDVTAEVGDKIRVRLASNRSTGFQWSYEISGADVLKEEDRDYEEPEGGALGAAGVEVFTFEAHASGSTKVHMEYARSGEGGQAAQWTYDISVKVE